MYGIRNSMSSFCYSTEDYSGDQLDQLQKSHCKVQLRPVKHMVTTNTANCMTECNLHFLLQTQNTTAYWGIH